MPPNIMICDAHVHIGYWKDSDGLKYYSPRRICGVLTRCGVVEFVVASTSSQVEEIADSELLREAMEVKRCAGQSAHIFYWLTGQRYDRDKGMSFINDDVYEGIKLHGGETQWVGGRQHDLNLVLDRMNTCGKKVMIHCGEQCGCNPRDMLSFVLRYPGVNFNFSHCRPVDDMLYVMREAPNVFTDVSFLPRRKIDRIMSTNVSDRVMFGSDMPVSVLSNDYGWTSAYRKLLCAACQKEYEEMFANAFHKFLE